MKKIKVIIPMIAILGMVLTIACSKAPESIAKSYLIDVTDKKVYIPSAERIKQGYGFQHDLYNAAYYRMRTISDVSYTETYEAELQKGSGLLDVEQERIEEINKFYEGIDKSIGALKDQQEGKSTSSIYMLVIAELEHLRNHEADQKTLVIYSDLREHNTQISLYHRETIDELRIDPEAFKNRLLAMSKVPDLEGIDIEIIYRPESNSDAIIFESVARVYQYIFKAEGANVTIQTLQ